MNIVAGKTFDASWMCKACGCNLWAHVLSDDKKSLPCKCGKCPEVK